MRLVNMAYGNAPGKLGLAGGSNNFHPPEGCQIGDAMDIIFCCRRIRMSIRKACQDIYKISMAEIVITIDRLLMVLSASRQTVLRCDLVLRMLQASMLEISFQANLGH